MVFGGDATFWMVGCGDDAALSVVSLGEAGLFWRVVGLARFLHAESSGALYTFDGVRSRFSFSDEGAFDGVGTLSGEAGFGATERPRLFCCEESTLDGRGGLVVVCFIRVYSLVSLEKSMRVG